MDQSDKNSLEIDGVIRNDSVKYNAEDGTAVFDLYHEEWKKRKNPRTGESEDRKDYLLITIFVNTSLAAKSKNILRPGARVKIIGKLKYQRGYRIDARDIKPLEHIGVMSA